MTALGLVLPKTNSAADEQATDEPNEHGDGSGDVDGTESAGWAPPSICSDSADDAEHEGWGLTDPPPLPSARKPEEILDDLKSLVASDSKKRFELVQEQTLAPPVMVPLAGKFAICYGGPSMVRGPMSPEGTLSGSIDSRDTDPTLSKIVRFSNGDRSIQILQLLIQILQLRALGRKYRSLPLVVFDIGRLYLKKPASKEKETFTYQPTDYRAVMDRDSKAVWLFYEYYEVDEDESTTKVPFRLNSPLAKYTGHEFDSAIVLRSIEQWDDELTDPIIKKTITESCFMSGVHLAPTLIGSVQDLVEASQKQRPQAISPKKKGILGGLNQKMSAKIHSRRWNEKFLAKTPFESTQGQSSMLVEGAKA